MNDRVYLFQGKNLLVPGGTSDSEAPDGVERESVRLSFGDLDYYTVPGTPAGSVNTAALLGPELPLPPSWRVLLVREAAALLAEEESGQTAPGTGHLPGARNGPAAQLFRIYHILQWRKDSSCCGSCGAPNGDASGELARLCPRCGRLEFPRISPAVITLVTRDDGAALLAHNTTFKEGVYSLIAGFVDPGESLEAAVIREIREEVNIEVQDIRYMASQGWPFPNSLMVGFTARYAAGELKPDGREITAADWFSPEAVRNGVPAIPAYGSVSRTIIDTWLAGSL